MQADAKGTGIIEALDAAAFMKKFGLSENVLSEVRTSPAPGLCLLKCNMILC